MTPRLMQLFDFTAEDLTYNRKGALSPRQLARVTKKRRAQKLVLAALGLGLTCLLGGGLAMGGRAFALHPQRRRGGDARLGGDCRPAGGSFCFSPFIAG